jgi:TolB-like protein/DNA-binding winged helix-turn-helix (wHTH) protein/Tfp pilus assembly protein PilF
MPHVASPPGGFRFGVFEVDVRNGELTKQGKRLSLQEQPFQLLVMLLEKPGEVVTREEVRLRLWPQTIVDFDHGLNKAISKIRDALGDSAENPRFIETVARRGYRFLADVAVVRAGQPEMAVADLASTANATVVRAAEVHAPQNKPPLVARWKLFAAVLAIALAVYIGWVLYRPKESSAAIQALAVLPLESFSADTSQDYFADGMTEELITDLGQISALRVISRTSVMPYKGAHRPLAQIARDLNVQAVVEGSVFRSGDRVRISVQLIGVPADQHLWAQSYEGDLRDALALQNQVAQAIADQIRVTVSRQERAALKKSKPVNAVAYDSYLKGRYYWNMRTAAGLTQAIEFFKQSIAADPSNAEAYSGLADSYSLSGSWEYGLLAPAEAFPQAKAAADEALALDDSLAEAHTSLALVLDLYYWDWNGAEKQYKLAISLNPGYATAHHWYAWHLFVMGRNAEALYEMRRAESLDPLSLIIRADLADALCIAHLFDEAVQQSDRALALDPTFGNGHFELGEALVQKHQYQSAIAEFQKAIELSGHLAAFDANLANAYAVSGRRAEATAIARDLEARSQLNPSADANIALIYVGLGDWDQAMNWLNKAYDARFYPTILLRPTFDALRSNGQFQDLRRRMGLAQQEQKINVMPGINAPQ